MSIIESLTPKDAEEIKPGLFVQKKFGKWRKIEPLAWDGKMRWKEQLKTIFRIRTLITMVIIIYVAYAYAHDTAVCRQVLAEIQEDPYGFVFSRMNTTENYYNPLEEQGIQFQTKAEAVNEFFNEEGDGRESSDSLSSDA